MAADNLIDCFLKLAGIEPGLNIAKKACSKVLSGWLLKDLFHQLDIYCNALINIHLQLT